jgi:hypothetical protein
MTKTLILSLLILASCAKKPAIKEVGEVSCGQCNFDLDIENGCDLAVRLDGIAYFIDGAHIDDFGDAHDNNTGFCYVIRKAEVEGKIEEGRYKASSVILMNE